MTCRRTELIMGMPIEVDVRDEAVGSQLLDQAFDSFRSVDAMFSTYLETSAISRFNAGQCSWDELDPSVRTVLDRCERLRSETDGYFDVRNLILPVVLTRGGPRETSPGESSAGAAVEVGFDPSGYVKGWAVDRVAALLNKGGAQNFCVNAGGDVRVLGGALPDRCWRIGIQHPLQLDKVATVVEATDLATATSGEYMRGNHIVDPHTGQPPDDVLSVTVVGSDLGTADAYATAAFAMGAEGPRWTMGLTGYEAMTVMANELILFTPNFPKAA